MPRRLWLITVLAVPRSMPSSTRGPPDRKVPLSLGVRPPSGLRVAPPRIGASARRPARPASGGARRGDPGPAELPTRGAAGALPPAGAQGRGDGQPVPGPLLLLDGDTEGTTTGGPAVRVPPPLRPEDRRRRRRGGRPVRLLADGPGGARDA